MACTSAHPTTEAEIRKWQMDDFSLQSYLGRLFGEVVAGPYISRILSPLPLLDHRRCDGRFLLRRFFVQVA